MTENEAIRQLKYMYKTCMNEQCRHKGQCDLCYEAREIANKALEEIQQYREIGTVEEVRMLKDYKELYDVYKLIGTIEEFRNLKYKKNFLPIATIEFSKEDMQKMVDEKVAQIELNIQGIRAKAIDDFANRLHSKIIAEIDDCADELDWIDEIAEQLKEIRNED